MQTCEPSVSSQRHVLQHELQLYSHKLVFTNTCTSTHTCKVSQAHAPYFSGVTKILEITSLAEAIHEFHKHLDVVFCMHRNCFPSREHMLQNKMRMDWSETGTSTTRVSLILQHRHSSPKEDFYETHVILSSCKWTWKAARRFFSNCAARIIVLVFLVFPKGHCKSLL